VRAVANGPRVPFANGNGKHADVRSAAPSSNGGE